MAPVLRRGISARRPRGPGPEIPGGSGAGRGGTRDHQGGGRARAGPGVRRSSRAGGRAERRGLYGDCRVADEAGTPAAWAPGEEARAVRCASYLEGMAHVLNLNCLLVRRGVMGGEVPAADVAGADTAALVRAFLAWAGRHPGELDEHRSVAGVALVEAFPCR